MIVGQIARGHYLGSIDASNLCAAIDRSWFGCQQSGKDHWCYGRQGEIRTSVVNVQVKSNGFIQQR